MEERNVKKTIRNIIILLLVCLVVAGGAFWFSRSFLIVFPIEGSSMENTLHSGDKVVLFKSQNVKYGDVVVFVRPDYTEGSDHKYYVKRVIGLAGDKIEIKYNIEEDRYHVYRNEKLVDESTIKEPMTFYNEVSVVVPEGKFFFLGDNRMNSNDSHTMGGTFLGKITDITGKAFVRYSGWTDIQFL